MKANTIGFFFLLFSLSAVCRALEIDFTLGPVWRTAAGGEVAGQGMADDETVRFITGDRQLYVLDQADGTIRQKIKLSPKPATQMVFTAEETITIVTRDEKLERYNKLGELVWRSSLPGPATGPPIEDYRGIIYLCTKNGYWISYTHTGRLRWRRRLAESLQDGPVFLDSTAGMAAIGAGSIYRLTETGRSEEIEVPYSINNSGGIFFSDGLLGIVLPNQIILTNTQGRIIYAYAFPSGFDGQDLPFAENGVLLVRSVEGTLLFLTAGNGNIEKLFSIELNVQQQALGYALTGDYLFAGTEDWVIHCFLLPVPLPFMEPPQAAEKGPVKNGEDDPNSLLLSAFAGSGIRSDLSFIIDDTEKRLEAGTLGGGDVFVLPLLENIINKQSNRVTARGYAVQNNIDDLKIRAAVLAGRIGNLQTQAFLSDHLLREVNPDVQAAVVGAMGRLAADPGGTGMAAVRYVSEKNNNGLQDKVMAGNVVFFVASVMRYRGLRPDMSTVEILYPIFRSDYPTSLRKQALRLLGM